MTLRIEAFLTAMLVVTHVNCPASDPSSPGAAGSRPDAAVEVTPQEPGAIAAAGDDRDVDAGAGFPADYCLRAGGHPLQVNTSMLAVAQSYDRSRVANCRTAGLLPALDQNQTIRWLDYLKEYSRAMAGCRLDAPVPGGVLAFGPANTQAALGIAHPPISIEQAELLSEQYLDAFAAILALSQVERQGVAEHLRRAAEPEIDDAAVDGISLCADAGPRG